MKKFLGKNKGFTLLELLVVISIIGILIAIGSAAFTTAQRKGRDARRTGDIKSIQDGFEQYYAGENGYVDDCDMFRADYFPSASSPLDPKTGAPYSCTSDASAGTYCVCAELESGDGNSGANCTYGGTGYYCLSNLQ